MPKMKTKKSIMKRIKVTATGKLMHGRKGDNHLRSSKSAAQKRRLAKPIALRGQDAKNFRSLLPYI